MADPAGRPVIIAVCGKGGVGKTSLSALIIKLFAQNPDKKVLAIDADPAVGLATALGITVGKTVDDIRNDLIRRVGEGQATDKARLRADLDYELFSAMTERQNLAFLAIGRPEKEGCYCQVNHMLKDIITALARHFDYVVIDGEAGIEQVNRRVMETVTHLVLVSDASRKGLHVAETIRQVADEAVDYEEAGLIVNRIYGPAEFEAIAVSPSLCVLGWVPEDETVRNADMEGKSILDMPASPAFFALEQCLAAMGLGANPSG